MCSFHNVLFYNFQHEKPERVDDLFEDIKDGLKLISLLEVLSSETIVSTWEWRIHILSLFSLNLILSYQQPLFALSQSHSLIISISLSVYLNLILSLSQSHSLFISISLCVYLNLILSLSQSHYIFISISFSFISISLSLCLILSLSQSHSLFRSNSLSLYLNLILSLSQSHSLFI